MTRHRRNTVSIGDPGVVRAAVIGTIDFVDFNPEQFVPWAHTILTSVERAAAATGGSATFINIGSGSNAHPSVKAAVESAIRNGANAAVVIFEDHVEECSSLAATVDVENIPIVFVGQESVPYPFYSVYYDGRDAACQATTHLIRGGARDLLFFAPYTAPWLSDRASGVMDAAAQHAFPAQNVRICIDDELDLENLGRAFLDNGEHEKLAFKKAKVLLERGRRATGIVAANDLVAYGFIRAASEQGLEVGKDYIIVGFDDLPHSIEKGLSTLQPPLDELGREAVHLASRALAHDRKILRSCLHSHLAARRSGVFVQRDA